MRSFPGLLRQYRTPLVTLTALISIYTAAGFLLLPYLARSAVTDYVENTLGRRITIGELRFNPYTFEARIDELRLSEADGAPLLGFGGLVVNADPLLSLFTLSIRFHEFRLVAPDVSLVVDPDGSINLARLVPPSDETDTQKESGPLPDIRIATLAVEAGRVGFEDRSRPQPFATELKPIEFALSHFRTQPDYENDYRFSASSSAGETLAWRGRFTLQPLGSEGEFSVKNLLATTLGDYLQQQLPLRLAGGALDLEGRYRFALQPALELSLDLPTLRLREFAVSAHGATETPVTIREVAVDALAFSLARREVSVQRVGIDGAQIDVRRAADGSINLQRLLSPTAPAEAQPKTGTAEAAAPAETAAPWQVAVNQLEFRDAAIRAEDRAVKPAAKFTIAPLGLRIEGYRSDPATEMQLAAEAKINDSANLKAAGSLRLQPLDAKIGLSLDGFGLRALQPYLAQATLATLHGGVLGVKGDLAYLAPAAKAAQLRFLGDVKVDDFRASGSGEASGRRDDFARWKQLAIEGIDYRQSPDQLSIARVSLRQPFARVVINPDQTLNVAQILKPSPAASGTAAEPSAATTGGAPEKKPTPMPVRVKQIRIEDGSAFFADRSIEPAFATGIVKLGGAIDNLSSDPASRATIKLNGQVDRHSPVEISGTSSLLAATQYSDIRLAFRNMELTTFNPYSGKFAGYNIVKGKLTTELSYKLDRRQLEAEHRVIIDQLEFGEATQSKDAVPLPVKLAVALLKDRRGVIDLELPVRGSLDDPEFKYGQLVWKVVGNLMTKIVTAPFAALGSLFGSGADLSYLDFAAGSPALTPEATSKLADLGKALVERPQLKLDVPTEAGDPDRAALARGALAERLPAEAVEERARLRALEKLHKELLQQSADFPEGVKEVPARIAYLEPLLLEKLMPDDDALRRLGQRRARAVQEALLANPGIAAERIFITSDRPAAAGDGSTVRLELKLQ